MPGERLPLAPSLEEDNMSSFGSRTATLRPFLVSAILATLAIDGHAQIYSTDFTTLDGWTVIQDTGIYTWAVDATPSQSIYGIPYDTYTSAPSSLNFNNGVHIGGEGGHGGADITAGIVRSPWIDIGSATVPRLRFMGSAHMEGGCTWDNLTVRISDGSSNFVQECLEIGPTWQPFDIVLDPGWGTIWIEFDFHTFDGWSNGGGGPFIDDLFVVDDTCTLDPSSECTETLSFCFGDGSGTPCPCANESTPGDGRGCTNSSGAGALLTATGDPQVGADTLAFDLEGAPSDTFAFLISGAVALPATDPGAGIQAFDGLRCVGNDFRRHGARATDTTGTVGIANTGWGGMDAPIGGLSTQAGFVPGQSRYFQVFVRDDTNASCGTGLNTSNALKVTFE